MSKNQDFKTLKAVFNMAGSKKISYGITIMITGIASPCISLLFAMAFKKAVNAIEYQQMDLFKKACGFVAISIVIQCIIEPFANCYNGCTVNRIVYDIKTRLFQKVERLPISYFDKNHSGDIMSRLTSDIEKFEPIYRASVRNITQSVVYGVSAIVCMTLLSYKLTIVSILCAAVIGISNAAFNKRLRELGQNNQRQVSKVLQTFLNVFEGVTLAKMFQKQELLMNNFSQENTNLKEIQEQNAECNAQKNSITFGLTMLSKIGVFAVGLYFVSQGQLDIGSVVTIVTLQTGISGMFQNLGGFLAGMQENLAGAIRVFEILQLPDESNHYENKGVTSLAFDAAVAYEGISFQYSDEVDTLKDITFNFTKNHMYAIVGTNGSGKSTLMKLACGFYPAKGNISILSMPFKEYSLAALRNEISYVDQDTSLFDVSIMENIMYGNPNASEEEVYEAAKKANIHDFILGLPNGYQTMAGDKGTLLSGGQRQRIVVARAILKDAPVIILDEATASLDLENELQIFEIAKSLSKDHLVIVIAHRLRSLQNVDTIVVMEDGQIKETGNHSQLMEQKGLYHHLYELQANMQ